MSMHNGARSHASEVAAAHKSRIAAGNASRLAAAGLALDVHGHPFLGRGMPGVADLAHRVAGRGHGRCLARVARRNLALSDSIAFVLKITRRTSSSKARNVTSDPGDALLSP